MTTTHDTAPEGRVDSQPAGTGPEPGQDAGVVCRRLTKYYGRQKVVDDLSFAAPMGAVTGFVGVNGAGKTTTMRILLGLVTQSSGQALVAGRRYVELDRPRHTVGAVLERIGGHPGQTGVAYLKVITAAAGISDRRVPETLDLVDLAGDGHRRIGGYSLGMRQRLALASALLTDPKILVLDEPANGLDPLGIRWIRGLVRRLAGEGRCVLVSSHQLDELEAVADRIVMIHQGRLIADTGIDTALAGHAREVTVSAREPQRLAELVARAGGEASLTSDGELVVRGLTAERIGEIATAEGVVLSSLAEGTSGLEELFLELSGAGRSDQALRGQR